MRVLKLASCMAENGELFCQNLAAYIQTQLGIETVYTNDIPWQEREWLFDAGEIQILWLCGLPYVHKADLRESDMELLAVPVPADPRYLGRAVYFSDVIVRTQSPFQTFAELRGKVWAYNEPRSQSGYNVVRAYLSSLIDGNGFFGKAVESGAHMTSLAMVMEGRVDCAAIDSTVLEWFLSEHHDLREGIRVVETFGPSPIPPWVISRRVPESDRERLRKLLLKMDEDPMGGPILSAGRMARFVAASDTDYDPIRRMARAAKQITVAVSLLD
jgi:phosphonate transport system substrate-binding protein